MSHRWLKFSIIGLFSLLWLGCSNPTTNEVFPERTSRDAGVQDRNTADKSTTPNEGRPEPQPEPRPEPKKEALTEVATEAPADGQSTERGTDAGAPEHKGEILPEQAREKSPDQAAFPKPGFGAIRGACNILDDGEWKSSKPFLFRNAIDFGTMKLDDKKLTAGGQKIKKDGNLGGSSVYSEIFAYELLQRCESATLLKSESEINYKDKSGRKTDILVKIDGRKIGVSVTRAVNFPRTAPYTEAKATSLLKKKLTQVPESASNASSGDAWVRSILHVIAYNKQSADVVESAYKKLDAKTRANIILFVTTTDGDDTFIY